jgi:hypothetical protein
MVRLSFRLQPHHADHAREPSPASHRARPGLSYRRIDRHVVIIFRHRIGRIVAFVPLTLSVRENLADARSAYPLIRHLQSASPILLAAPALVGIVLHRIRQEMGGGQLATSLRFMLAFLVVRLAVLLVGNLPIRDEFPSLLIATQAASWAAPWLFPLMGRALAVPSGGRETLESDRFRRRPRGTV